MRIHKSTVLIRLMFKWAVLVVDGNFLLRITDSAIANVVAADFVQIVRYADARNVCGLRICKRLRCLFMSHFLFYF